jgi:hypothetical protein
LLNQGGLGFLKNPTARVIFPLSSPKIGKLRKNDPGNFSVHKPVTRSVAQERNKVVSEPTMTDQRVERLESEVRDIQELLQGLSAQLTKEVIQEVSAEIRGALSDKKPTEKEFSSKYGKNKGVSGSSHASVNVKVARLEFPCYDGTEDPTSWICWVDQYFEFQNTEEENKVMLTAYHLEGKAQLWH